MVDEAPELAIEPLSQDALPAAADVLARAFRDNPLNTAVLENRPPDARRRANAYGMRALLPIARSRGITLVSRAGATPVGVLIAAPPHAYPFPPPSASARLRTLLGQGLRAARRWNYVFEALDRIHPRYPHWYLATLGVHPAWQSRGVGSGLLRHWLGQADRDRLVSYLETDRAENLPLYEREGFEVVGEAEVLGVPIWRMRRPAPRRAAREAGAGERARAGEPGAAAWRARGRTDTSGG